MPIQPAIFETHEIRRVYDEASETWWFSVVDIIQVLIQQPDYQAARNYWKVLKNRLTREGSESVTKCNRLKLPAADGKNYLTDVATAESPPCKAVHGADQPEREDLGVLRHAGSCAGRARPHQPDEDEQRPELLPAGDGQ
jgi:hypothetical protein